MALTKWLPPTRRHDVQGDQDRVTWLELFFDLVYVAALIQLGDDLSDDVSWRGLFRFLGLFALLWWTWTGTTAYTNRFAVDDIPHRVLVFLQMFAVANVALVAVGPNENRWAWLAVSYVGARIPLLIMYARLLGAGGETTALARKYLRAFSLGTGLWILSIPVDEPLRFAVWGLAFAIEFVTPIVAVRKLAGPPIHEHHFRERYAVFTIIVFGETFVKTLTELAEQGLSIETQVFGTAVFVAAAALWWTYFDDIADSTIRRTGQMYRISWVYGHLPLAAAITAFGVGSKKMVGIEAFADTIDTRYLWLFGGSIAVALIATAFLDMLTVSPHFAVGPRLRVGAPVVAAAAVLIVCWQFDRPALLVVSLLALLVAGQIAVEVVVASKADQVIAARVREDIDRAQVGCSDLEAARRLTPPTEALCPVCSADDRQWVELRQCQTCGYVGCCDDSEGRHARSHFHATGHVVIASIERDAAWGYCYAHDAVEDPWHGDDAEDSLVAR